MSDFTVTDIESTPTEVLALDANGVRRSSACDPDRTRSRSRVSERILLAYFSFTALLACIKPEPRSTRWLYAVLPLVISVLTGVESRHTRRWSSMLRDWSALVLIPVGYWEMDAFRSTPLAHIQTVWARWDHLLLHGWGVQRAIESFGPAVPDALELIYLLLYAIPPASLGVVYYYGHRRHVDGFLTTLFLGTMSAYMLLPFVPAAGPRFALPGQDLPHFAGLCRWMNLWLLDHLDIATSVFPSGHVAVAFSSAFAVVRTIPERPWVGRLFLALASLVYVATIYGRYHYAVDGLCSITVAIVASGIAPRCFCDARRQAAT